MPVIEQITPKSVSIFKATRLQALQDSPTAFGSTYAKESLFTDEDWGKRAAQWTSERSMGYLAMEAGKPCGIVASFLDENDPHKAQLVSMWVAPTHRRSGVGQSLIETVRAWAASRGARQLLLTVTSNNLTAIKFYQRNGFSMTGNTEPYPNDPVLFEYEMARSI